MEETVNAAEQQGKEVQKLSYEQLENVARQLNKQCEELYGKLQQANMSNAFQRLNYLFKVIENADKFDVEFAASCVTEIQEIMTITPEQASEKEE